MDTNSSGVNDDKLTPDSDDWWVDRLSRALMEDKKRVQYLIDVYYGYPLMDLGSKEATEGFTRFLKLSNLNLAALIVNSMTPRIKPIAFKTASEDDDNGDDEAFRIMKRCNAPVVFADALLWASITGRGYVLVNQVDKKSWLTAEHPTQAITEKDPITGRDMVGFKLYHDDIKQQDVAVLYRNDYMVEYTLPREFTTIPKIGNKVWCVDPKKWDKGSRVKTGTKSCAMVEVGTGTGEFEPYQESLRRINHTILQRLVIVALQAFKQRAIKGVPRTDPKTGKEIDYSEIFTTDPGAMWILPEVAEIWESGQVDLTPIITSIKEDTKNLAVESMTPLYSITPDAAQGSAEGAALQREMQVFKVEDRIERYDGSFCRMMALCFEVDKDELRSNVEEIEVVWKDPNRSSLTERAASAMQATQAGAPWRYVMTNFIKMNPRELADAERERRKEQLMMMAMGGTGGPAPAIAPGVQSNEPAGNASVTSNAQRALEGSSSA